jgi:hypothetical protein
MNDKGFNRPAYEKFIEWANKINYKKFYAFVLGDVSNNKTDISDLFNSLPKNWFKIFLKGDIDPVTDIGDITLHNPSFIKIEDSVTSLLCHCNFLTSYSNMQNTSPEILLQTLLRKRHLNPVFDNTIYHEDPFIIDTVPDLFVSAHFHSPTVLNYKGTTILTTGSFITEPVYWLTNLRTRETIKIDFT